MFAVVYVRNCVIMVFDFCFHINAGFFSACGIVFPPHRLFKGIDANVFTQSIFHSFFNYPIFAFVDGSGGFNSIGSTIYSYEEH